MFTFSFTFQLYFFLIFLICYFIYPVHTILKALDTLAKTFHQFRNLFTSEQQQND